MAFEQGVATSAQDLLDKIRAHAVTQGWVITNTNPGVDGPQINFDSGDSAGFFFNAVSENAGAGNGEIRGVPSSALTATNDYWDHVNPPSQATASVATHTHMMQLGAGPFTQYFIFSANAAPRYIHVVVEVTAGVYSHLHFGVCNKFGTYDGGFYTTGTLWSTTTISFCESPFQFGANHSLGHSYLRCDGAFGEPGAHNWREDPIGMMGIAPTSSSPLGPWLMFGGLSATSQRSVLAPMYLFFNGTINATNWATNGVIIIGEVQDLRMVSMDGRTPGEIVTIGADQWYIFPVRQKSASAAYPSPAQGIAPNFDSGFHSIAYKRVN